MSSLLRGGRLSTARNDVTQFTSSIESDKLLFPSIIQINQAHIIMLTEQKIITKADGVLLLDTLHSLKLPDHSIVEDLHMYIEEQIIAATNEQIGGNLHIAKSRNDQVATAIRMKLRQELCRIMDYGIRFQETLLKACVNHHSTIIPGYTHLQPAQPITYAHYLLSCIDALTRSIQRIQDFYSRVNLCPMGACALATSSFPINRERVAKLLGFSELLENSLDAVGSRDFILEALSILTILANDISRFVEDLILWSSFNFNLLELPDAFASTSSIMPQKKNPDVLEVIRARTSYILGNLISVASTLKSLPSSYNLDFQEITPKLWESLNLISSSITMLSEIFSQIEVKSALLILNKSYATSTELANTLTRNYGVSFRQAHKIVGALIKYLIDKGISIHELTEATIQNFRKTDKNFSNIDIKLKEIRDALNPEVFITRHNIRGGPAPTETKRMLQDRQRSLILSKKWISEVNHKLDNAQNILNQAISMSLNKKHTLETS